MPPRVPKPVLASEVPEDQLEHYVAVEKTAKILTTEHTLDSMYDALTRMKRSGTSVWWKNFEVVKVELADKSQQERWWAVKLKCTECEALLSTGNPSAICAGHLSDGVCRQTARRRTAVHSASGELDEVTGSAAGALLTSSVHCLDLIQGSWMRVRARSYIVSAMICRQSTDRTVGIRRAH
jgi:hypothetical protein